MYKAYLCIRMKQGVRALADMGALRVLVVLLLLSFGGTCFALGAKPYFAPALYLLLVYARQALRKDKRCLKFLFKQRGILLLYAEYALYALPLCALSLLKTYRKDLPLYPLILVLSPSFSHCSLKRIPRPSNPLFLRGSYEYQSSFRTNYLALFILYFLSILGMIHRIPYLIYGTCLFAGFLYCPALMKKEPMYYAANFLSWTFLIRTRCFHILFNQFVLLLPMLCAALILREGVMFMHLLLCYLSMLPLMCVCSLQRYAGKELMQEVIFVILLLPLSIVSVFISPWISFSFIPILACYLFLSYRNTYHLFHHA
jgi:hypothetical protein